VEVKSASVGLALAARGDQRGVRSSTDPHDRLPGTEAGGHPANNRGAAEARQKRRLGGRGSTVSISSLGRSRLIPRRFARLVIRRETDASSSATSRSVGSGLGTKRSPPRESSTNTPWMASV
jgi:hypothetical protein